MIMISIHLKQYKVRKQRKHILSCNPYESWGPIDKFSIISLDLGIREWTFARWARDAGSGEQGHPTSSLIPPFYTLADTQNQLHHAFFAFPTRAFLTRAWRNNGPTPNRRNNKRTGQASYKIECPQLKQGRVHGYHSRVQLCRGGEKS